MLKRALLFVFIFTLSIRLNDELVIVSANPLTASSNLKNLGIATDFKLLTPNYSFKSYKLEIKEPYPLVLSRPISKVRLHYFDKSGQTYMFGIEEHKAADYKIKRIETHIDVRNQTSTTRTIVEDFKFDLNGEQVNINGIMRDLYHGLTTDLEDICVGYKMVLI